MKAKAVPSGLVGDVLAPSLSRAAEQSLGLGKLGNGMDGYL